MISMKMNIPSIVQTLAEHTPLPHEALFLGVAEDGLPVLLNTHDSSAQAVLVYGEDGMSLLETAYRATLLLDTASQVVTIGLPFGEDTPMTSCYPTLREADTLLSSAIEYMRNSRADSNSLPLRLLLVDGDSCMASTEIHDKLLTVIQQGSRYNFWTILLSEYPTDVIKTHIHSYGDGYFRMREGERYLNFYSKYSP